MPTISQLVRKGRKVLVDKSKSPAQITRAGLMSPASRCLCTCLHNDPEEA